VPPGHHVSQSPNRQSLSAASRSSRRRVLTGWLTLVEAGSIGFTVLGRMGAPRAVVHAVERWWARAVARVLRLELDIEGMEHIDPTQGYVVVALHEGFADAIALMHLPLRPRFLVRDELFAWKALGRYLEATDQIRVSETRDVGSLRRLYEESAAALARGDSLIIFPQGSILGVEVAFQPGAFRLAQSLGSPILPVVLSGSHRVWEHPYSPLVRLDQRIFARVLPPIAASEFSPLDARELEREMKRIALNEASVPPRRFDPDRDGWWDGYRFEIDPDFPEMVSGLAVRRARSS